MMRCVVREDKKNNNHDRGDPARGSSQESPVGFDKMQVR